ncbi:MAG: right-handed parallel beta-helix repeat-containing protein [Acidobacteria bacterium]|nr:right-handed parallel beta-helix repeat-containing protein [Acidobacteriota bacterium]
MLRQILGICLFAITILSFSIGLTSISAYKAVDTSLNPVVHLQKDQPRGLALGSVSNLLQPKAQDIRAMIKPVSRLQTQGVTSHLFPEVQSELLRAGGTLEQQIAPGLERRISGIPESAAVEWTVAPWADPGQIELEFPGVEWAETLADQTLVLHMGGSKEIRLSEAVARQEGPNQTLEVPVSAVYYGGGRVGISVGIYSRSEPLVVSTRVFVSNATFNVTNLNDSGSGSLRQAITDANNNGSAADTITFQSGLTGTISLSSSLPLISGTLTITGPGASTLTVNGGSFTIFSVANGITLQMSGLRVTGGGVSSGLNAAHLDVGGGTATLSNCEFSGANGTAVASFISITMTNCAIINASQFGLRNGRTAALTNVTISNCGTIGLESSSGVTVSTTLVNCTIANNASVGYSANLRAGETHSLTLKNTIIANNLNPQIRFISNGGTSNLTSQGFNLLSDNSLSPSVASDLLNTNPILAALASNGGTTQTRALLPGSPAINAGTATGAPTTDQRGISRVGTTDIGAFESRGFTMALSNGNNQSTAVNTSFATPLSVTVSSANSEPVNGGQVTFTPPVSGASCTIAGNPATISSGTATTGTVTANGTTGGPYTVAASAQGVTTGVNFSLTNNVAGTTVSSMSRASTNPACINTSVSWTVTFAASVTGVTTSNFSLVGGTGASITGVSGSGTTRTVTANTGTAAATLGLNMVNATGVSPGPTNLPFTGQTYTVNGNPTTANAGSDQAICSGSATLAANNPSVGTGQWSVVSGPSTSSAQFSSTSSPTATFTPAGGAGTYTLRWTISNSPCTASTDDVVITLVSTVVTNGNDSGAGSLRQIITDACAGSTITFSGVTTVTLTTAELAINKNLTINGGSGVTVTRSTAGGTPNFRIFNITSGSVAMNNLTISNGNQTLGGGVRVDAGCSLNLQTCLVSGNTATGNTSGDGGGGLWIAANAGNITINQSTISGNSCTNANGFGGGLRTQGALSGGSTLTVTNSTINNNTIQTSGAGLYIDGAATTMTNCTISNNSGNSLGGGILFSASTATLTNVTIANNSANNGGGISSGGSTITLTNCLIAQNQGAGGDIDVQAAITSSSSFNLIGVDFQLTGITNGTNGNQIGTQANPVIPRLGGLASNGGPTQTRALLPGSPAVNAGTNAGAPTTDQRGISRPQQSTVDIGAFESRGFTMAISSGNNQSTLASTNFTNPLAVTVSSANSEPVNGGRVTFTPPGSGASCTLAGNPATITSGTATTGTVTANATTGSYTVAASAAGVTTGVSFNLNNTGTSVTSINRASTNPACTSTSVTWTVTFAASVTGVSTSNFSVVGGTGASVTSVTGSGTTRTVTANTGTAATASLGLNMVNSTGVNPGITNLPFTGQTYSVNGAPTTANAGPDQSRCVSTPTTTLAANTPTTGNGLWTVVTAPPGGNTLSAQFSNTSSATSNFTPSPAVTGNYTLRWTISNSPCTASTDDVVITYQGAPTVSNAGPDQTLCLGTNATLAANNPTVGTGQWSVVSGPSTSTAQFSNTASQTATFTPASGAGAYTLRWTISNSPCTASTDDVVITYQANPTASNAGPDQTLCVGSNATLAANNPTVGTGQWSVVSGPSTSTAQFSSVSNRTATFTPAGGPGAYTLRWTISNSPCTASTDDVVITYQANPTGSNAGPDQTLCLGTNATLAANTPGTGTGQWSVVTGPSTSSAQFSSTSNPTATFTPASGTGTYTLRWTISNAPCTASTDDVAITINSVPTVNPVTPTAICSDGTTNIALTSTPSGATFSWTIGTVTGTVTGQTAGSGSSIAQTLTGSGAVTYVVTGTLSGCPSAPVNIVQTVNPNPVVNPVSPTAICSGGTTSIALTSTPSGATFSWTIGTVTGTVTGQTASSGSTIAQTLTGSGTVTYVVTGTLSGCPSAPVNIVQTVNPNPVVNPASPPAICSGGTTNIALTSTPSGASFSWTIGTVTGSVTGQTAGSGSTIAQTLTGSGTVTYVVTGTLSGCPSAPVNIVQTVNPNPTVNPVSPTAICNGGTTNITLTSTPSGASFSWTIGTVTGTVTGQTAGSGSSIAQTLTGSGTVTYVVTGTLSGCPSAPVNVVQTVTGPPSVNPVSPAAICSGGTTSIALTSTPGGATFDWTIGTVTGTVTGQTAGSGSTIAQTLTGSGTVTYVVTPSLSGCTGTPVNIVQTVNPNPVVNPVSPTAICSGGTTNIALTSTPSGASFSWTIGTVTGTVTGQTASSGNTIAQTLTGNGTVTYVVTGTLNGCPSAPVNIVQTVNPNPVVNPVSPTAICSGGTTNIALTSTPGGASFSWTIGTVTGTVTGQTASSGSTIAQTLTGSGSVTYIVTGTLNGCPSAPVNIVQSVTGPPSVNPVSPTAICSGGTTNIALTSTPGGASFSWTIGTVTGSVTGQTAGSGSTIAQTLTGSGTVTYVVTPSLSGCTGSPVQPRFVVAEQPASR